MLRERVRAGPHLPFRSGAVPGCFLEVLKIQHFDEYWLSGSCSSSQVNYILDEIVMAGMVLETNADLILKAVKVHASDMKAPLVLVPTCTQETKKLEQEGSTFGF